MLNRCSAATPFLGFIIQTGKKNQKMAAASRFDTSYVAANSSNSSLCRERLIMMSVVMTNTVSNNTVNLHALYVRVSGFTGGTVDCGLPASAPLMEVRPPVCPSVHPSVCVSVCVCVCVCLSVCPSVRPCDKWLSVTSFLPYLCWTFVG